MVKLCAVLRRGTQGVSKVAFKLTKSNISQIRLWLFLSERKRGVAEGGWKEWGKRETDRWSKPRYLERVVRVEIEKSRQSEREVFRKRQKERKKIGMKCLESESIFSDVSTCEMWCRRILSQTVQRMNPETLSSPACLSSRILSPAWKKTHWPTSSISALRCCRPAGLLCTLQC